MDVRRKLGLNVTKYREKLGLSQEDFAAECDLHRTYVSGVERGHRNPTILVVEKLALGLKVEIERLFDDISEPKLRRGRGRPRAAAQIGKKALPKRGR